MKINSLFASLYRLSFWIAICHAQSTSIWRFLIGKKEVVIFPFNYSMEVA